MQSYGSDELDASLLLIPIVGFLSPEDVRVRGTVAAIEQDLKAGGFVLRYRTEKGADGLPPGEGAFLPCSFWLADNYSLQGREGEAKALFEGCWLCGTMSDLCPKSTIPGFGGSMGNFPQAFSHLAIVNTALGLRDQRAAKKRSEGAKPARANS